MSDSLCFSPVPFRALCDGRLARADLAVLGIVAAHDRFAKNGRGCDAGRERIAHLAGLDVATASRSITKLEELGYLTSAVHAEDRRRRVISVLYTDEDKAALKAETNPTQRKRVTTPSPNAPDIGDEPVIDRGKIGDIGNRQVIDFVSVPHPKIFCETEGRYSENPEEILQKQRDSDRSRETAVRRKRSVASILCQTERELKSGRLAPAGARRVVETLSAQTKCRLELGHAERVGELIALAENPDADAIDLETLLRRENEKSASLTTQDDFETWSPRRHATNVVPMPRHQFWGGLAERGLPFALCGGDNG